MKKIVRTLDNVCTLWYYILVKRTEISRKAERREVKAMYAKNSNHVTFWEDVHNTNTEKVIYGVVSEAIKTGKQDENGKDVYEYENWNARFVGKAYEGAKALKNNTRITLKEWCVRCPYSKEKKRTYPYIMVMDFEIRAEKPEK